MNNAEQWTEFPIDYISSATRTGKPSVQQTFDMHKAKQRAVQVALCRRWIPVDLLPVFDELLKDR